MSSNYSYYPKYTPEYPNPPNYSFQSNKNIPLPSTNFIPPPPPLPPKAPLPSLPPPPYLDYPTTSTASSSSWLGKSPLKSNIDNPSYDISTSSKTSNNMINSVKKDEDSDIDMAYSPSRADSDDEESRTKVRITSSSSLPSLSNAPITSSQNSYISSSSQPIHNDSKKRKLVPTVGKLKRVAVKGFGDDDDDDDDDNNNSNNNNNNEDGDNHNNNNSNNNSNNNNIHRIASDSNISMKQESNTQSLSSSSGVQYKKEPEISSTQLEIIKKTAQWAIKNPEKMEIFCKTKSNDNVMRFLFDKTSVEGKRYLYEYNLALKEKEIQSVCAGIESFPVLPNIMDTIEQAKAKAKALQLSQSFQESNQSAMRVETNTISETRMKRERVNRWGPPISPAIANSTTTTTSVTLSSSSSSVSSYMPMDARMAAQIQEQKELQLLEARIREAAKAQGTVKVVKGVRIDEETAELYEERMKQYSELAARDDENFRDTIHDAEVNNGIIDGGTWEHRKRAKEMLQTATTSIELTTLAQGKHHIADFLPKEELNKFLKKSQAIRSGEDSKETMMTISQSSDAADPSRLTEDNIGYQLLSKQGWKEGKALGSLTNTSTDATSSAILEPIQASVPIHENAGIGVKNTTEVEAQDDNFDEYRKRMMLAYRFRPNPLNNPRRAYY